MKHIKAVVAAFSFSLVTVSVANANPPVLEVSDHIRGMKYTTFDQNWSFSPVGKFGVSMVNSKEKRSLRIKKSFSKNLQDAISKKKVSIEKGKDSKLMSEAEKLQVAGSLDATGMSWENAKRGTKAQELFFEHGGKVYEAQCEARKGADFAETKKDCALILSKIEIIK